MSYNSPYKKGDFFLSNKKKQEILVLDDVVIKNIYRKQKHIFEVQIRDEKDMQTFQQKDKECYHELIRSNEAWFHNSLDETTIQSMWKPNYDIQTSTVEITYPLNNPPMLIYNDEEQPTLSDFWNKYDDDKNGILTINVKLVCMKIEKKQFSNIWILRNINFSKCQNTLTKEDINEIYHFDIKKMLNTIDKHTKKLENEIEELSNIKKELNEQYNVFSNEVISETINKCQEKLFYLYKI